MLRSPERWEEGGGACNNEEPDDAAENGREARRNGWSRILNEDEEDEDEEEEAEVERGRAWASCVGRRCSIISFLGFSPALFFSSLSPLCVCVVFFFFPESSSSLPVPSTPFSSYLLVFLSITVSFFFKLSFTSFSL